jgi:ArsR family transcriptional regulator, arsenate/arsenite/antimonite-responsive transcriptional repressor
VPRFVGYAAEVRTDTSEQSPPVALTYLDDYLIIYAEMDDRQFNLVAKALADPQRFALLRRVAEEGELGCKRLVSEFPIRQATISHHMKELTTAGLVEGRKAGQCMYFRSRPEVLADYLREVDRRLARKPAPRKAAAARA